MHIILNALLFSGDSISGRIIKHVITICHAFFLKYGKNKTVKAIEKILFIVLVEQLTTNKYISYVI